jgi:hypothetical protein
LNSSAGTVTETESGASGDGWIGVALGRAISAQKLNAGRLESDGSVLVGTDDI